MNKSALSILSHVAHGYVGNRCIVFPLQYNGWDVDAINTTNYSNHPGYGSFRGKPSSKELIEDILTGLNGILNVDQYDIIVTGYFPNQQLLQAAYDKLLSMIRVGKVKWVFDPVLGDAGRLYVPEDVVPMCRQILASGYIDLTTPNQFEFETLTDCKITDLLSLTVAISKFRQLYRVENVVISSINLDDKMISVGINKDTIFYFPIEKVRCHFNGSGDLFAALLSNGFYDNNWQLSPAVLGDVLVKMHNILQYTYNEAKKLDENITSIKDLNLIGLRAFLLKDHRQDLLDKVVYIK